MLLSLVYSALILNGQVLLEESFDMGSLDESIWTYKLGNGCPELCGWGNNEPQLYTREQLSIENGNLNITIDKRNGKYYSSRINTKDKFEFQYGTVEARAKVPRGKGLWPALWMLGSDIDTNRWPG